MEAREIPVVKDMSAKSKEDPAEQRRKDFSTSGSLLCGSTIERFDQHLIPAFPSAGSCKMVMNEKRRELMP